MNDKFLQKQIIIAITAMVLSACAGPNKFAKTKRAAPTKHELISPVTHADLPISTSAESTSKVTKPMLASHYLLNSDKTLNVDIAASGYSRISIEGERISDVFVYPQEAIGVKIHDQGYLILVPNANENTNDKIYLTVSGEKGTTQDFVLRFRGGVPAPIKFIKPILEQQQLSTN